MAAVPLPRETGDEIVVDATGVSFAYGTNPVLEDVTFSVHKGEFAALVGPERQRQVDAAAHAARGARARVGHGAHARRGPARAARPLPASGTCRSAPQLPPDLPATVEEVVRGRPAREARDGGGWPDAADRDAVDHALAAGRALRPAQAAHARALAAASSSASTSPRRSSAIPRCSCSTSRSRASTRSRNGCSATRSSISPTSTARPCCSCRTSSVRSPRTSIA